MNDLMYYSALFDYYGELLSEKEKDYFKDYYFENLTLQEIAENNEVSRNAVSKALKSAKEKMEHFEEKLHLLSKKEKIKRILDEETFLKIEKYL